MTAQGWAKIENGTFKICTVHDPRCAAIGKYLIVKWLTVENKVSIFGSDTDNYIEAMWVYHRCEATVGHVKIEYAP
ncbi:MAG: hypothetical protein Q7R45_08285 [Sulfuricaulis sp.]|nr:hypothetical protein [Sulfuricaulis sp.]